MGATHVAEPASSARTGVWIAIATISMSFAAYTSALLVRQGTAPDWAQFRLPPILYLNTLVLLASSATIAVGRRRMTAGAAGAARSFAALGGGWLALTLGSACSSSPGSSSPGGSSPPRGSTSRRTPAVPSSMSSPGSTPSTSSVASPRWGTSSGG